MGRRGVDWEHCWDDLRFPVQGINPQGITSPPDIEAETGLFLFSSSLAEVIAGVAQFPHAWWEGTAVVPHVHWHKSTSASGDVVWEFRHRWANNGDVYPDWSDWIQSTELVSAGDVAETAGIAGFGYLTDTTKKISSMMLFEVRRNPAATGDTYGADAVMTEFDIHYMTDFPGSRAPGSKHGAKVHNYAGEIVG